MRQDDGCDLLAFVHLVDMLGKLGLGANEADVLTRLVAMPIRPASRNVPAGVALGRQGRDGRTNVHAARGETALRHRVHLQPERRRIGVAVLCVRHLQRGLERRDDVAILREGDVSPMPVVGNPPLARVRAQTVGVLEVGKL